MPDADDGCPYDAAKTAAGACGCGKPDTDHNGDGVVDCSTEDAGVADAGADAGVADAGAADAGVADAGADDAGIGDPPLESTIFFESFESPDVATSTQVTPNGWIGTGHPSYISIMDEALGTFSTPYGQQALDLYTTAPPNPLASVTTAASKLSAVLEARVTYTLTVHVARHSGKSATGYVVELLAIDDVTGTETVLDAASGSSVVTSDMSQSDRIVFATGLSHGNLGQRIAVRLRKEPSVDWMSNPLFDNVRLSMRRDR